MSSYAEKFKKGSMTVEASLIFPILVLLVMFFLHTTISCFELVTKEVENIRQEQELDTVDLFWKSIRRNHMQEMITERIREKMEAE